MAWSRKEFPPRLPPAAHQAPPSSPSPPLMRFLGSIGFTSCGLGTFYIGQRVLGVSANVWEASSWDAKAILLLILSFGAGAIGGLAGLLTGASISVKSEHTNHLLNILWHSLANGSIIWFGLLGLCLSRIYGEPERFIQEIDKTDFTLVTLGVSTVGSLLIGGILLAAGPFKFGRRPHMLPSILVSLPIAMGMGYLQFTLVDIKSSLWVLMGTLLPLALIPAIAYMTQRDRIQREQLQER